MGAAASSAARAVMSKAGRLLDGAILAGVAFAAWQGAYEYAGESAISSPLQTLVYASSFMQKAAFWNHAGATMKAFVYAAAIAVALGLSLGLILGLKRFAGEVAEPVLASIYTIPKITLYPLMLLVFGLGMPAKVAFGVIHGIIPIILFTLNAVKNLNPVLLRTARVMRLSAWQTISTVLAPSVVPELITGVRTGFSLTLLGVLIGEMFASQQGLGFLIINGISLHNVQMTTAVILAVIVFAIAANSLLLALDRRAHHSR
jgi:NitT/TauT family transport system permease protein